MMNISRRFASALPRYLHTSHVRLLFSAPRLGVDRYLELRDGSAMSVDDLDAFRSRIQVILDDPQQPLPTEILAKFLHVASDNQHDQTMLSNMINKFTAREDHLRFWPDRLGPVVMRYLYHFKLIDTALEMFRNSNTGGFFDQLSSCVLLMNALYTEERYQEVLDVYDLMTQRQIASTIYPRDPLLIAITTCYKLNTEEACDWMERTVENLPPSDYGMARRQAAVFIQTLVNVGRLDKALNHIEGRDDIKFGFLRDIMVILMCKLDRTRDAVQFLRGSFEQSVMPGMPGFRYRCSPDMVSVVEEAVQKKADAELTRDFDDLNKGLVTYDRISSATLDDVLTAPLLGSDNNPSGDRRGYRQQQYRGQFDGSRGQHDGSRGQRDWQSQGPSRGRHGRYQRQPGQYDDNAQRHRFNRPGLTDMVD